MDKSNIIDKNIQIGLIVLNILIWLFIAGTILKSYQSDKTPPQSLDYRLDGSYYLIEGNSIKSLTNPAFPKSQVLGMLLEEIIKRESGGDPNAKNPKSTAYGYCQFIDQTWQYVQKKWGIKLDRYNPDDQLYACGRLLEEEGIIHWKSSGPY